MRKSRIALTLEAVVLLAGLGVVAAPAQKQANVLAEVRPDKALVYMVRLGEWAGRARTEKYFLEDELIGVLPNDSYTYAHVTPGTRLLWGSFHKDAFFLDLLAGHTYYLMGKVTEPFTQVTETEARAELAKMDRYRTISAEDQVRGSKEGREKWPGLRTKYAAELAVGAAEPTYVRPASTEGLVKVAAALPIEVELLENINSATSRIGDPVWVRVSEDVAVDGAVIVRQSTVVKALVRSIKGVASFGRAARMDVAVLSVTATDGTVVPLAGRVDGRGKRKSTELASVAGGVLAAYLVKGGQAFSPAGEMAIVHVREDVWVKPREVVATDAPAADDRNAIRASLSRPVACELTKGKGPALVDVLFETADDIASASMVQVRGMALPAPVNALKVTRAEAGVSASFDGWTVCRYLRPSVPASNPRGAQAEADSGTPIQLRLVTNGGTTVYARLDAQISPQR